MNLDKRRLRYLLWAYLDNRIKEEELAELRNFISEPDCNTDLEALLEEVLKEGTDNNDSVSIRSELMYHKIWNDPRVPVQQITRPQLKATLPRWRSIAALAAILFLVFGLYLSIEFDTKKSGSLLTLDDAHKPIVPGSDKALLTLADGRTIHLDQTGDGILANEAGIRIIKTEDGEIFYETIGNNKVNQQLLYNTISTPRGGEYRVVLPDGTKVWLNAESSLHYPSRFSSDKRIVELAGEAYFEVSKAQIPFFVKSSVQTVEVLGTHFNINAYKTNPCVRTTLLEGSVRVYGTTTKRAVSKILQPNQQSSVSTDTDVIRISSVDASKAVAWKNGYFAFYDENIVQVMNTLARWYDIDIDYEGDMSNKMFGGTISRFENIETLLKTIELTGSVRFRIEGRKVIVMT